MLDGARVCHLVNDAMRTKREKEVKEKEEKKEEEEGDHGEGKWSVRWGREYE